jgi:tRNA U55 pseudouridine synthase TruB
MVLGIGTVSLDVGSEILDTVDTSLYCLDTIKAQLETFISSYTEQTYPIISSFVLRHGEHRKPLWWFKKHNIPITPPSKSVTIHEYTISNICRISSHDFATTAINRLETIKTNKLLTDLNIKDCIQQFRSITSDTLDNRMYIIIDMTVDVSSGFYIRQLCNDFGKSIGLPAIALDITRTKLYEQQHLLCMRV